MAALAAVAIIAGAGCTVATRATTVRTPTTVTSQCPGPAVAPTSVTANGRTARLTPPANYDPSVSYPLLVSLHPFVLNANQWEIYSGLAAHAASRGYWVLSPNGSQPGPRWAVPGGLELGPDDVGHIDALITATAAATCFDTGRIFAAGFSAGAAMAVGLSCELPWRFKGVAASGGANLTSTCPNAAPVATFILHGAVDSIAAPSGSTVIFAPPLGLSVAKVLTSVATRNGCTAPAATTAITTSVIETKYTCTAAPLVYWSMLHTGHTWAGASIPLDLVTGPTNHSFSASSAVVDFFNSVP
jgi:polyhydroxybutyrate depolymerase